MASAVARRGPFGRGLQLARILLVEDKVASRLTLKTLLQAGGYAVEEAASAAEAVAKLDFGEYQLVLSDLDLESRDAGIKVLTYARQKHYRPATAMVTAYHNGIRCAVRDQRQVLVDTEVISSLLEKVADLLALRASRRAERALRSAAAS